MLVIHPLPSKNVPAGQTIFDDVAQTVPFQNVPTGHEIWVQRSPFQVWPEGHDGSLVHTPLRS
jgi:hypothetical protein